MIDPNDVIKFDRTDAELQEWWLFSTIVAGKTASTQARLLEQFLSGWRLGWTTTPFQVIRLLIQHDLLDKAMRAAHLGQYSRLVPCWTQSLALDLRHDPVERFEEVHGVGPKTARMFLMHSRPDQRFAAIDTHVLKHLKAKGHKVPNTTPPAGRVYRDLEQKFLALADEARMTPADYDLAVWRQYSNKEMPRAA